MSLTGRRKTLLNGFPRLTALTPHFPILLRQMRARALSLPTPEKTVLLVCDIQEKFRPLIWRFSAVVKSAGALLAGARVLKIESIVTEQNPSRLGATVSELQPLLGADTRTFGKTRFSMLTPEVIAALPARAEHAILCGIEAHVCIKQTALELLARDMVVHLVVDGVSSQRSGDRAVALSALEALGVRLTTTEAILFELLGDAKHSAFKDVQKVAIAHAKEVAEAPSERLDVLS
jgi:nicotinamidase-related amidase